MMTRQLGPSDGELDPEHPEYVYVRTDSSDDMSQVSMGSGSPPITGEDFRAALRLAYASDTADRIADDAIRNGLHRPGGWWSTEILLWVALLSDAHAERIRAYLGWSEEKMAREMARARAEL